MTERLSDEQLGQLERRIDQEFTGEAHLTSDEMRAVLAELREGRTASETGTVALLRIRERAAKKDNEKLKLLLGWALGAGDAIILACAGSGATPQKLDAMDRLHGIRDEAKRLGVE